MPFSAPEELIVKFWQDSKAIDWGVPPELAFLPEVTYRNNFAQNLHLKSPEAICASYVYMSAKDMRRMYLLAINELKISKLKGVGLELGAGCGLLSSVLAIEPEVNNVFALEICRDMAELVIPKIAQHVLRNDKNKIIPVIGSFDEIKFPDGSLDFIVEIDSLHHSKNLVVSLRECARVLKKGGLAVFF